MRSKIWLPTWLLTSYSAADSNGVSHLCIRTNLFNNVQRMPITELSCVYGDFFREIWLACKKRLGWKGNIAYDKLTPQWLLVDVVFLYGVNNSSSIPCSHGALPRKAMRKDHGQAVVGSAILTHWMENECGTRDLLRMYINRRLAHIDILLPDIYNESRHDGVDINRGPLCHALYPQLNE